MTAFANSKNEDRSFVRFLNRRNTIKLSTVGTLFFLVGALLTYVTVVIGQRESDQGKFSSLSEEVSTYLRENNYYRLEKSLESFFISNSNIVNIKLENTTGQKISSFEREHLSFPLNINLHDISRTLTFSEAYPTPLGQMTATFDLSQSYWLFIRLCLLSLGLVCSIILITVMLMRRGTERVLLPFLADVERLRLLTSQDLQETLSDPTFASEGHLVDETEFAEHIQFRKSLAEITSRMLKFHQEHSSLMRDAAIARTTQMLAHDVRKPFSSLQLGLKLIKEAKSQHEMREMANITIISVQQALVTVNGLINDVMEIGRTSKPTTHAVSVESLLKEVFIELFQVHERCEIHIEYCFNHNSLVDVDKQKISRAFSNILGNAVQAMRRRGRLVIATRDVLIDESPFLEFTLGNDGPPISAASLPDLFEAFYTNGKEAGTGLGLAIAKKVVEAHGGSICCCSPGERMPVEFRFTVPASKHYCDNDHLDVTLPRSADEVYEGLKVQSCTTPSVSDVQTIADPREAEFERVILSMMQQRNRRLRVGVVDDEVLYRNSVTQLLGSDSDLQKAVDIFSFCSGSEALDSQSIHSSDAVICDIDLGPESCNGYEVIRTLRCRNYTGHLCVHSNRTLPEDFKRAMEAGADTVFPKPMSRAHLLQILAASVGGIIGSNRVAVPEISPDDEVPFPYQFAVIDDDATFRQAWKQEFKDTVTTFDSIPAFLKVFREESGLAQPQSRPFDFLVTDFHLARDGDSETGASIARIVADSPNPIPVFLCSDAEVGPSERLFAGRIRKTEAVPETLLTLASSALGQHPGHEDAGSAHKSRSPISDSNPDRDSQQNPLTAERLRLRHDLRNELAAIQIIIRQLKGGGSWTQEFAERTLTGLATLDMHCQYPEISRLRDLVERLDETPDATVSADLVRDLIDASNELVFAHYQDPGWQETADLSPPP